MAAIFHLGGRAAGPGSVAGGERFSLGSRPSAVVDPTPTQALTTETNEALTTEDGEFLIYE